MEERMDERYLQELGRMRRPIPGQSLTNDPGNPLPFEGPPIFTKKREATEEIFANLIREDVYPQVINALLDGTPIMDMTKVILFEGFRQGKWNPDLFTLLIEPTAYIIMALADRAEVEYDIDNDSEPDEGMAQKEIENKFERIKESIGKGKIKSGVIPKKIEEQIKEMPVNTQPSLLSKGRRQEEVVTEEPTSGSLLSRPAGNQVEE